MTVYALIPLLSVFAYATLAVLVMRHRHRGERRAFTLYLVAAGFWSFVSFSLRLDIPFLQQHTLLGSKVLVLALLWMTLTYYHFVRVFVHKPGFRDIYLGSGFVLVVALLAGLGLVPRAATSVDGVLLIDNGPAIYLYALFTVSLVSAAVAHLWHDRRRAENPLARTRIDYMLTGLAIVSVGALTNLNDTLAKYPVDHLGNLASAIVIAYAILRYQLLDIAVVVRRGLVYSTLTMGIMAVYLFMVYFAQEVLHDRLGYSGRAVIAGAVALIIGLVFAPLRNLTQERVDRLLFRTTYEYRRLLTEFRGKLNNALDLERLAGDILDPLVRGLGAQWAALLLPDVDSGQFSARFVRDRRGSTVGARDLRFVQTSPLLDFLAQQGGVVQAEALDSAPQGKGLWQAEKESLQSAYVRLLCPMLSRGKLTGILALGTKQSGHPYSEEDQDLFLTIATGAAVALDNARMLDDLRRQQQRAEVLLAQVVTAQEEERERIAVELHDGVAQWLVRATYQVQVTSALLEKAGNGKGFQGELATVEEALEESIRELRRVLAGLRPPALEELGLTHALRQVAEKLEASGLACHFALKGPLVRLPLGVEIAVYRIVQEALNNVSRHARASSVTLCLDFRDDILGIEILDDGRGFDVARTLESAIKEQHLGLLGMRQRVEWLGGDLTVESKEGVGTKIAVRLPVAASRVSGGEHGHGPAAAG